MAPGNTLFVARQVDGRLLFIVVPEDSSIDRQLRWLFGFSEQLSLEFAPQTITTDNAAALDFTTRYILDELGIELEDPAANTIDSVIEPFGIKFPTTMIFSDRARATLAGVDAVADPDGALLAWLDHEDAMFRRLEHRIIAGRLAAGFGEGDAIDVDGFVRFSLSVQNRRKSRMGLALENHLGAVFRAQGIRHGRHAVTERGNRPDFLFPGAVEYCDPAVPPDRLTMLASKSTLKERWRQVLPEADRIAAKHLVTLEPAISPAQTDQMREHALQLVVPQALQATYQPAQQAWLWSLSEFVSLVKTREIASAS